jgi:hypothetical protein
MKSVNILFVMVMSLSLCLVTPVWAERALPRAEILQIINTLTESPHDTWIPAGTIQATHEEYGAAKTTDSTVISSEVQKAISEYQNKSDKKERTPELQKMKLDAIPFNVRYKLANEHSMSEKVTVKYDGDRFYWEINVDSRRDSVKPDMSLADNFMTEEFNLGWNAHRIFAWDGQKYTTYTASGGQAVVDAADKLPRAVSGPLTAGLIPWGRDRYAYADLAAAQTSAKEVTLKGKTQIEMTITYPDGAATDVTLDPSKAYAVTAATFDGGGREVVTYTCSGYRLVGSNWVPSSVSIERRDRATDKLLSSEQWTFTAVTGGTPAPGSFAVPFDIDTLVEYASPVTASSSTYLHSYAVDTDELLMQRLAYAAAQKNRPQNCGTAALQYVAAQLGKSVSDSALARLVGPNGQTSLSDMKRFAQGLGLQCLAVRTDLATLRDLDGVKVILHIPGKNHFLVLHEVDDQYVWLIDLSSDKFFYRQDVDFFPQDWSEGVALLISDRPISGRFNTITDAMARDLIGSSGYSCSRQIQDEDWLSCNYYQNWCDGEYTYWPARWGCTTTTSGSCTNQKMVRYQYSPCIWDPIYVCSITGNWYYAYMLACR